MITNFACTALREHLAAIPPRSDAVRRQAEIDDAAREQWLWNAARWPVPFGYSDLGPDVRQRPGSQGYAHVQAGQGGGGEYACG